MRIFESCSRSALVLIMTVPVLMGCAGTGGDRVSGDAQRSSDVALTGLAQIGSPYVYGGETPATGFDCSGLTHYAHYQAGLSIPRTALEQRKAARPVGKSRLRAGDMVFFKTGPNAYHVGLMIDSKRFVHASTSRKQVRVSKIDNPYWMAHFLGGGTFVR